MTDETIAVADRRIVCPECGRYRGVQWRVRTEDFICRLCSHVWPKVVLPSADDLDRVAEDEKAKKETDDGI